MRATGKILNLLSKDGLALTGVDNLFSFIEKTYSLPKEEIKKDFYKLLREGRVFEIRKGKFIALPSHGYTKGRFIGNSKGFAFVDEEGAEQDIFIPADKTRGAIDGDGVVVKLYSSSEDGRDGEVVGIYSEVERIAGVVIKVGKHFFLQPDNNRIPFKIKLVEGDCRFHLNDRAVVRLIRNKSNISARVIEILGKQEDVKACELAIIRDHGLYETFPEDVLAEAGKIKQRVMAGQLKGRVDLRDKRIFTIDGLDAKDLDDGVSIERRENGYLLGVHIADVGNYVKCDCKIDEEAYKRGTSVYFPTTVLPMLPKELSNGICSLNEGVDRLTLTCQMLVDEEGNVKKYDIFESVINSKGRLNYDEAYKVICGERGDDKHEEFRQDLLLMNTLSNAISKKNRDNGTLDFEIPEVQFVFDEGGRAIDFVRRERNDAHILIENFMVLANMCVAKEFCDRKIPFVYRVHEAPRREKTLSVIEYLKNIGISTPSVPEIVTPEYYQALIKLTAGKPYADMVNKVLLRSMQKARYTNKCLGHFGLALKYYCHFTSPIRRYPDLTIHRIIKECLKKGKLSGGRIEELELYTFEVGEQSSLTERNADKTEREVDDLWRAYLMKDRVGEDFEGVISSVTNFGIFVELDNTVEGLIKIEDLPDTGFLLFEKQLRLKGQHTSFCVGDRIKVKLVSSNIFTRKIDFQFLEFIEKRGK